MSRSFLVATMRQVAVTLQHRTLTRLRDRAGKCHEMQGSVHRQRRVEADRQTYSLFRESSSVALQASTDLEGIKMMTMVRRLAAQEHSVALAQLASRISAIMKFGVGADDDPFVKVKVQTVSASQKQTSCLNLTMRLDRIGAAVLNSSQMAARFFTTMQ